LSPRLRPGTRSSLNSFVTYDKRLLDAATAAGLKGDRTAGVDAVLADAHVGIVRADVGGVFISRRAFDIHGL
jgi:hypothetical protein